MKFKVDRDNQKLLIVDDYSFDLCSEDPFKEGDLVFVVTIGYTTGSSFGRDLRIYYEYYGPFTEYTDASSFKSTLPLSSCEQQQCTDYKYPWIGYFEELEFVKIEIFRVTSDG